MKSFISFQYLFYCPVNKQYEKMMIMWARVKIENVQQRSLVNEEWPSRGEGETGARLAPRTRSARVPLVTEITH